MTPDQMVAVLFILALLVGAALLAWLAWHIPPPLPAAGPPPGAVEDVIATAIHLTREAAG